MVEHPDSPRQREALIMQLLLLVRALRNDVSLFASPAVRREDQGVLGGLLGFVVLRFLPPA